MKLSFYISGIIQGSKDDNLYYNQRYREEIKKILKKYYPNSYIYCPCDIFGNVNYTNEDESKQAFFKMIKLAENSDVIICFLPEASMGSAVELWQAYKRKKIIITISALKNNLFIKSVSSTIVDSMDSFESFIKSDNFVKLIKSNS